MMTLVCVDCRDDFTLSDREVEIFTGIDKKTGEQMVLPKRCKHCRLLKRQRNEAMSARAANRLPDGEPVDV